MNKLTIGQIIALYKFTNYFEDNRTFQEILDRHRDGHSEEYIDAIKDLVFDIDNSETETMKLYDVFCQGFLVSESISLTYKDIINLRESHPEHTFKLKEKNHANHQNN